MTTYILISILCIAVLVVGYVSSLSSNETKKDNFLIANRSVGPFLVASGLIMGWVDAGTFGWVGGLALQGGYITIIVFIVSEVLPFILLATLAPKIRQRSENKNMIMMSDVVRCSFSNRSAVLSGVASFMYFFFWMMVQFVVGTSIIHAVFGVPQIISSIIMGFITFIYLSMGGFRSQVYTDVFQFVVLMLFIFFIIGIFIPPLSEWGGSIFLPVDVDGKYLFSIFILFTVSTLAAPDVWQRIYSSDSEKSAKKSMLWSALIVVLVDLFFAGIGFIAKHYNFATSPDDLAQGVFTHLIPEWFLPFSLVVFFSLVMSTIATTLFGSAMSIVNDIFFSFPKLSKKLSIVSVQRVVMFILVIIAVIINFSKLNLVTIIFYSFVACMIPFPFVFVDFVTKIKLKEVSVFYSMIVGTTVYFFGLYFGFLDSFGCIYPLLAEIFSLVIFETVLHYANKTRRILATF